MIDDYCPQTRQRRRPAFAASLIVCLAGLALAIFMHWLIGIIVILLGALLDRVHYTCTGCGNTVSKTSRLCPACHADLLSPGELAKYYRSKKKARR